MRRRSLRIPVAMLRFFCLATAWMLVLVGVSGYWVMLTTVFPIQRISTQAIVTNVCGEVMLEMIQEQRVFKPAQFHANWNTGAWSWWHWPIYKDVSWGGRSLLRTRTLIFPIWIPILLLFILSRCLRQLRPWLNQEGLCECGYSLVGLTKGRCPECGTSLLTRT